MVLLLVAFAAAAACDGTTETKESPAIDLATELSGELRAYRDAGLETDLERARGTCAEIRAEDSERRLQGTDQNSFRAATNLTSACDVVEMIGVDPAAQVETAIALVDVALGLIE